jgi:hypothetical protein
MVHKFARAVVWHAAPALLVLLVSGLPAFGQWSIEFIPKKSKAVTVIINGEAWARHVEGGTAVTWKDGEGRQNIALPAKYNQLSKLPIVAVSKSWGTDSHIKVRWNNQERQNMEFSKEEDKEVGR